MKNCTLVYKSTLLGTYKLLTEDLMFRGLGAAGRRIGAGVMAEGRSLGSDLDLVLSSPGGRGTVVGPGQGVDWGCRR